MDEVRNISQLTEKVTLVDDDLILIVDSEATAGSAEGQSFTADFDDSVHLTNQGYGKVANDEIGASYYLGILEIFDL